jgi:hypothetical protein
MILSMVFHLLLFMGPLGRRINDVSPIIDWTIWNSNACIRVLLRTIPGALGVLVVTSRSAAALSNVVRATQIVSS